MGNFARDLAGFLRDVKKVLDDITKFNTGIFDEMRLWVDTVFPNQNTFNSGNPSAPGGGAARSVVGSKAPVVINFNTPVDSVSAGREIARVLSDYDRARGMR